jgi:hypothetical protein
MSELGCLVAKQPLYLASSCISCVIFRGKVKFGNQSLKIPCHRLLHNTKTHILDRFICCAKYEGCTKLNLKYNMKAMHNTLSLIYF